MEELMNDIVKTKWIYKLARKYIRNDNQLADDLAQEILLFLLEKKSKLLLELYSRNEHKKYITTVLKNNYLSSTSPFYKKYRKNIHLDIDIILNYENYEENQD